MAWFRCFIRGENFPGDEADPSVPLGFYTTRFVEAIDRDDAEARGLTILRSHPWLSSMRGHPLAPLSRVFFQEIEQIPADAVPSKVQGLVFFPMPDTSPTAPTE